MHLYSFEVRYRPGRQGSSVTFIVKTYGDRGDDQGQWEASTNHLGSTADYWQTRRRSDGFWVMDFTRREQPSALRTLFLGTPYDWNTLLTIEDILKWPLFVGETGGAYMSSNSLMNWRLTARGF